MLTTVNKDNLIDPNYANLLIIEVKPYKLNRELDVNIQAIANGIISLKISDLTVTQQASGWEKLEFNYNAKPHYIAFLRNKLSKNLTHIQTNCPIYLLQDLIHSLASILNSNNLFSLIHNALLDTPLEVRKLGKQSMQYRHLQRMIFTDEALDEAKKNQKLIELQQNYEALPWVKIQKQLPILRLLPPLTSGYYAFNSNCKDYHESFELDAKDRDIEKIRNDLDELESSLVAGNKLDNLECLLEENLLSKSMKILDVGFGNTHAFHKELKRRFPEIDLYGIEPNLFPFNQFLQEMQKSDKQADTHYFCDFIQDFIDTDAGKQLQGTFDLITLFLCPFHPDTDAITQLILNATARLLKPEGKLLITMYAIERYDPLALNCPASLPKALFAHFKSLKRAQRNHPLNTYVLLAESPLVQLQKSNTKNSMQQAWDTAFSDPSKHMDGQFTYLVTALPDEQSRQNAIESFKNSGTYDASQDISLRNEPHRIPEMKTIKASIISQNKPWSRGHFGLILKVPFNNIIDVKPYDLFSSFQDPKKLIQLSPVVDSTPSELLAKTTSMNEILIQGTTSAGKVEVLGFFCSNKIKSVDVSVVGKLSQLPLLKLPIQIMAPSPIDGLQGFDYFKKRLAANSLKTSDTPINLKPGFFNPKPAENATIALSDSTLRLIGKFFTSSVTDDMELLEHGKRFLALYQNSIRTISQITALHFYLEVLTTVVAQMHSQHATTYINKSKSVNNNLEATRDLAVQYFKRITELDARNPVQQLHL